MNILGFVPARKGSVGIKGKNFINLNGKPLIHYTLEILKTLNKKFKIQTFVSTNDKKIKSFCKKKGLDTSYNRPNKLSRSNSDIVDTVLHGLEWYENSNEIKIDTILLLQPTSPIRNFQEISSAIDIFKKKKYKSLASATPVKEHPNEIVEEISNKKFKFLKKSKRHIFRRQNYKKNFYYVDGNFYLIDTEFLKKKKTFIKENITKIFKLKRKWPVDIDDAEDLIIASALMKKN